MARNIFKNLPTDKHEKWKAQVNISLYKILIDYTKSQQYTFDTIGGTRDSMARKFLQAEINRMSQKITKQVVADHPNFDVGMVKRHFKAFVKDDCNFGITARRYNWSEIKRIQKQVEETA
jgi:hypothetical protein